LVVCVPAIFVTRVVAKGTAAAIDPGDGDGTSVIGGFAVILAVPSALASLMDVLVLDHDPPAPPPKHRRACQSVGSDGTPVAAPGAGGAP
jgi:hypothetical protein